MSSVRPALGSVLAAVKSTFRFRPFRPCKGTLPLSFPVRSGSDHAVYGGLKRSIFNEDTVMSKSPADFAEECLQKSAAGDMTRM